MTPKNLLRPLVGAPRRLSGDAVALGCSGRYAQLFADRFVSHASGTPATGFLMLALGSPKQDRDGQCDDGQDDRKNAGE